MAAQESVVEGVGDIPSCPKCHGTTIRITVGQTASVVFFRDADGNIDHRVDEIGGDCEWTDDSEAWCGDCGDKINLAEIGGVA